MPTSGPRLISVLGADFDFTALTEVDDSVREEILEELSAETVAEGVRDLDTDDAVYILEDLDEADKQEVLDRLTPTERIALQQGLDYPEGSAGRRMQSEVVAVPAVLDRRPDHRLSPRHQGPAGALLRDLRRRPRASLRRHRPARPAAAHQAAGQGRGAGRGG